MADKDRFRNTLRDIQDADFTQITPEARTTLGEMIGLIDPRGICFGTERFAIEKIMAGTLILASLRFAARIETPMNPQDAWAAGVISRIIDELLGDEFEFDEDEEFGDLMNLAMTAHELQLQFITKPEGPLEIVLNRLANEVPSLLGPPE